MGTEPPLSRADLVRRRPFWGFLRRSARVVGWPDGVATGELRAQTPPSRPPPHPPPAAARRPSAPGPAGPILPGLPPPALSRRPRGGAPGFMVPPGGGGRRRVRPGLSGQAGKVGRDPPLPPRFRGLPWQRSRDTRAGEPRPPPAKARSGRLSIRGPTRRSRSGHRRALPGRTAPAHRLVAAGGRLPTWPIASPAPRPTGQESVRPQARARPVTDTATAPLCPIPPARGLWDARDRGVPFTLPWPSRLRAGSKPSRSTPSRSWDVGAASSLSSVIVLTVATATGHGSGRSAPSGSGSMDVRNLRPFHRPEPRASLRPVATIPLGQLFALEFHEPIWALLLARPSLLGREDHHPRAGRTAGVGSLVGVLYRSPAPSPETLSPGLDGPPRPVAVGLRADGGAERRPHPDRGHHLILSGSR